MTSETLSFYEKFAQIQSGLVAPKGQHNSHGNFNYRSCEDILGALKPLLKQHKLFVTLNDEIIELGGRHYIKSTAEITDGKASLRSSAFAREALIQKGMNDAQITGSTSSYSRKFALSGLLGIDDEADDDKTNKGEEAPTNERFQKPANQPAPGDFVIQLGKYKGKKLKDIPEADLEDYCIYITTSNPNLEGEMKKVIDNAREYFRILRAPKK